MVYDETTGVMRPQYPSHLDINSIAQMCRHLIGETQLARHDLYLLQQQTSELQPTGKPQQLNQLSGVPPTPLQAAVTGLYVVDPAVYNADSLCNRDSSSNSDASGRPKSSRVAVRRHSTRSKLPKVDVGYTFEYS